MCSACFIRALTQMAQGFMVMWNQWEENKVKQHVRCTVNNVRCSVICEITEPVLKTIILPLFTIAFNEFRVMLQTKLYVKHKSRLVGFKKMKTVRICSHSRNYILSIKAQPKERKSKEWKWEDKDVWDTSQIKSHIKHKKESN